jgi:hypothetical protein
MSKTCLVTVFLSWLQPASFPSGCIIASKFSPRHKLHLNRYSLASHVHGLLNWQQMGWEGNSPQKSSHNLWILIFPTRRWLSSNRGKHKSGLRAFCGGPEKPCFSQIIFLINFDFKFGFKSTILVQNGIKFLINKHKNRGRFCLLGPPWNARSPDLCKSL